MSSFFIRGNADKRFKKRKVETTTKKHLVKNRTKQNASFKRKTVLKQNASFKRKTVPSNKQHQDEEISSDSELEDVNKNISDNESEDSREEETAQEKRLRLAKKYLEEIEKEEQERAEVAAVDKDVIAHRVKEDILEQAGKLRRTVADNYEAPDIDGMKLLCCKDHKLAITCIVISPDSKYIYSGSKDSGIVKWSLGELKKVKSVPGGRKGTEDRHKGHIASVLCMSISSDNKFLVSGDQNKLIHVWNPDTLELIHTFKGHRSPVTGLAFRRDTHQLFSVSEDRSVKIWSLDEMAYVETLFGHQSGITAVDALTRERAITSGGRDNTVRIWKIIEESQLIFNGHRGTIDCVKLVNEEHFFTCGDDGLLCLWGMMKKKPLCVVTNAHGVSKDNEEPNWITSIATLLNTDLLASGSSDGCIKLWKCGNEFRSLSTVLEIPVCGFVNGMAFTADGKYLVAGLGQEHRLGRWWRMKEAKNGVLVVPLIKKNT